MAARKSLPKTPPPTVPEDEMSAGETAGMAGGIDISSQKTANALTDLINAGNLSKHTHRISVCFAYVVGAAGLSMFVALVIHYIFPDHFLTPEQAADLQKFLFGGGAGALLHNRYSKKS